MQPLNDRRSWNFDDPGPDVPLHTIEPMAARAEALMRRSRSPLLEQHFLQIVGTVSILDGIDYHHDQFRAAVQRLGQHGTRSGAEVRHEAVAWINRVGQFHAFARSSLVDDRLGKRAMPAFEAIKPFRDKHTAHRSADDPHKDDTESLKVSHMLALDEFGGALWTPRSDQPHAGALTPFPAFETHYLMFQLQLADGQYIDLIIERDHPSVVREAFDLLDALLQ